MAFRGLALKPPCPRRLIITVLPCRINKYGGMIVVGLVVYPASGSRPMIGGTMCSVPRS